MPDPASLLAAQTLLIENLALQIRVGVGEAERARPQRLLVSLRVEIDPQPARRDAVEEVVDYGVIAAGVRTLASREVKLLETLAEEIAAIALAHPRARSVALEIRKPDLFADCSVGIAAIYRKPGAGSVP